MWPELCDNTPAGFENIKWFPQSESLLVVNGNHNLYKWPKINRELEWFRMSKKKTSTKNLGSKIPSKKWMGPESQPTPFSNLLARASRYSGFFSGSVQERPWTGDFLEKKKSSQHSSPDPVMLPDVGLFCCACWWASCISTSLTGAPGKPNTQKKTKRFASLEKKCRLPKVGKSETFDQPERRDMNKKTRNPKDWFSRDPGDLNFFMALVFNWVI